MLENITFTSNSNALLPDDLAPHAVMSSWGPKRDPLIVVIPITVIYTFIFFLGILGNISTCIVISRNKHMHTATNYYLFSLAVSDLLLLVCGLPPEMYYIWSRYPYIFGEAFCVIQGFAAETSANATVLTITAFTVERYVAICHPFQSHTMSKLSRAVKFVIAIWIVALCLAIPQAIQFGIVYEQLPSGKILDDEHTICSVKRIVIPHSFEISSILFFVAPMTLITILYILIGLQLHRSSVLARRDKNSVRMKRHTRFKSALGPPSETKAVVVCVTDTGASIDDEEDGRKNFARNAQTRASKHVVKMLVAVVVAFFICWAPFHAQRLLAVYGNGERRSVVMVAVYTILTYVSGVLYYLSTTVNPVLYHIMSNKFREAFKDTLSRYLRRKRCQKEKLRCYSVLSTRSSHHSNNSSTGCQSNSNASQPSSSSLRYLEADIARLHESKRPVVVSFKKHATNNNSERTLNNSHKPVLPDSFVELDKKMLKAYRERRKYKQRLKTRFLKTTYLNVISRNSFSSFKISNGKKRTESDNIFKLVPATTASFQYDSVTSDPSIERHSVSSKDVFTEIEYPDEDGVSLPCFRYMGNEYVQSPTSSSCTGIEEIEIFHEQQFRIQKSLRKSNPREIQKQTDSKSKSSIRNRFYTKRGQSTQEKINEDEENIFQSKNNSPYNKMQRSVTLPVFDNGQRNASTFTDDSVKNVTDALPTKHECPHNMTVNKVDESKNQNILETNNESSLLAYETNVLKESQFKSSYDLGTSHCSRLPKDSDRRYTIHNIFENTLFEKPAIVPFESQNGKTNHMYVNLGHSDSLPCCKQFNEKDGMKINGGLKFKRYDKKKNYKHVNGFRSLDALETDNVASCSKPSTFSMQCVLQKQMAYSEKNKSPKNSYAKLDNRRLKSCENLCNISSNNIPKTKSGNGIKYVFSSISELPTLKPCS